jgi:small GTP-binding protein
MQAGRPTRRKLVVVGDGACGKTCLLIAFTQDEYNETYVPTVFETYISDIKVDDQTYQFALWDTAGQEDYEQLRPLSYPNTDVIVVCFNIDHRDSFENVPLKWMPEIQHFCPRTPVVLVGTKIDLRQDPATRMAPRRPVSTAEGAEQCRRIKAYRYVECSAKTREGVKEVFETAARAAICPQRRVRPSCVVL